MALQLSNPALLLLLALAFLVLFAVARKAQPAQDASGTAFVGDQAVVSHGNLVSQGHTLKVASFNIQTGKSDKGKRDISRAANQLANVDIAGVQEVYAPTWANILGLGRSQSQAIASPGRFNYVFNATRKRWFREHRGNAVLARVAVESWQTTMLPDQSGKSYRNYTVVNAKWNDTPFVFINTHLHTSKGRTEQLNKVLEEFAQHSRAILVGDFNSRGSELALSELRQNPLVTDAIAQQNLDPNESERIDWIFTKGFSVVGGEYAPKGVSDHPYYEVHLQIN